MDATHRNGITRILQVSVVVAVLATTQTASAGHISVKITSRGGFCHAARAADGWYAAKHCADTPGGIVTFNGSRAVPAYSFDPSRDLMHIAGPASDVVLRHPTHGEPATALIGTRPQIHYVYMRQVPGEAYTAERTPGDYALWCWQSGRLPAGGDSGGGLYADDDDALVGILTNAGALPVAICSEGWGALAVSVP